MDEEKHKREKNKMEVEITTTKSPIDNKRDERVLDCTEPTNGMLPPSAKRRAGFTGLLDMVTRLQKHSNFLLMT